MSITVDPVKAKKTLFYRWICIGAIWLVYFFVYFDRVAPAVVAPEMMKEWSLTAAEMGLLSAAYFYPYAAMQLPSGVLSDFLGPRLAVAIFFTIAGIGTAMFGMAGSYDIAIVGRVCMGIGVAVVAIPIMKIQAQWFRPREFATLTGIMLTVGNAGALGAAAPLAVFVGVTGWRAAFYWLGAISIALAVLVFLLVRNRPQDMGLPTMNEIDGIVVSAEEQAADDAITLGKALKITSTNWNFWFLAIYAFCVYGPMMGFQGLWAVPYMMDIMNFTKQEASNVISFWAVGMMFGCPIAGIFSDRILKSRKKVVIGGASIYTLGWLFIALNPTDWSGVGLSVFCFCMGFFGGVYITNYPHVSENLPRKVVGTSLGLLNLFYFVGGAFFQQAMGKILDGYQKVQKVFDGAPVLDAAGNPAMVFPAAAYSDTFYLCMWGMVVGTLACVCTRETFGKTYGGVPTNLMGNEIKE